MSYSRSLRSCRIKPLPPILPEIISRINDLDTKYYENIRNKFNKVVKYFNDNIDLIASFWLTHYEYNLLDFKHQFLIKTIFDKVGLKHPVIVQFLNKIIDEKILNKLDVVRVNNGKNIFYRIHIGIDSSH
jgi:hypothetical protein